MTMIQVIPVILCGGSATSFWPLSRAGFPKQFLSVTGDESLFQQAAQRLVALGAGLPDSVERNTAPALTLAALAAQAEGEDPILVATATTDQTAWPTQPPLRRTCSRPF